MHEIVYGVQGSLASVHEEAKLWDLAGAKGIALLTEWILGVCLIAWFVGRSP